MNAEYLVALAALIGVAISFRTASHTELRNLFDTLRGDFDKYKRESQDRETRYEQKIDAMETEINSLMRQNENYKRYITRLIAQLEKASIIPVSMDD